MKQDRQFVTALARGMEVLHCFTPRRPVLGPTEIATLIGLPQPTVWRLCHTLVQAGYLVPIGDGKLRVGAAVLALGYGSLASLDLLRVMRPHMQQVADRFSAAVALAERHRSGMFYIEMRQSQAPPILNLKVGSRLPIHNTATGWAYLAALPAAKRAALLEPISRAQADNWPALQAQIDRAVAQYEKVGFVINAGVHHPLLSAAAAPVVAPDGRVLFAVNCGGSNAVLTPKRMDEEVGPAVVQLAALIAAQAPAHKPAAGDRRTPKPRA